mgnify:CR=1 FL=1
MRSCSVKRQKQSRPANKQRTTAHVIFTAIAATWSAASPSALADPPRHKGAWAGADAGSDVWLAYSGTTYTLFGDIHRNGLRLRIVGSYGRYNCESVSPTLETTRIGANVPTGNALIGYLWQIGPLILKPFMGASFSDQQFRPIDENNQAQGPEFGAKVVAEFWYNLGRNGFASLGLAWSQDRETRSTRARIPQKFGGISPSAPRPVSTSTGRPTRKSARRILNYHTQPVDYGRVGAFARIDWHRGDLLVSSALAGNFRNDKSAYGTINCIKHF